MELIKLKVNGEYGCEYQFDKISVILGDNNTGKSTFLKLILYCLGAPIKSFIDEISKMNLCDSVSLDIRFKNGKTVRILRNLPNSDAIVVTPIKNSEDIVNDEIVAFSASEFSDFLLENEGYSIDKITYSKDKTASFRFYFLLRALYVDQDTTAQSILSDLDMGHDYFTSQPTIKKSIIEKLLGKDNSELQRIRLEIQNLSKTYAELTDRISFLSDEQQEIKRSDELEDKKIDDELSEIYAEKEALASQEFQKVATVKAVNDLQHTEDVIVKQRKLNDLYEQQQIITLELKDIRDVIKALTDDLALLKYKVAAKDILEELPILYCPNCLSELSEETLKHGLCENCHKKTVEEKVINNATIKKSMLDSISEAKEIEQLKVNALLQIKKDIAAIQNEIREENKKILEKNDQANNLIYQAVFEIKKRLEYLLKREHLLKKYKAINYELERLKAERKNISGQLAELKEELLKVDTKASLSMQHFDLFKRNFVKYLNCMFDEVSTCDLDENYMPIIDNTKIGAVASASLKVAIRLSYVLALFNESLEDNSPSHLGILLLDSPKDKDLDNYRFEKYLQSVNAECSGQIVITGSISDEDVYKKNLTAATFFDPLRTHEKLLKKL
ncbi:MAG: hypothetical protein IKD04_02805 [Clostridia bacterium]|nr:hypothetical protein [Clostridia bacterium]